MHQLPDIGGRGHPPIAVNTSVLVRFVAEWRARRTLDSAELVDDAPLLRRLRNTTPRCDYARSDAPTCRAEPCPEAEPRGPGGKIT